jgi:RNase adapter protein RapZ
MRIIILTGQSGAGKSVALHLLEDEGFYCVDNLPASVLLATVAVLQAAGHTQVAVGVDARGQSSLTEAVAAIEALRVQYAVQVVFLEASEACLLRRFSETRRRHPLHLGDKALGECIAEEREMLSDLAVMGHRIDTSGVTANALRAWLKGFLAIGGGAFTVVFESFGFKHSLPLDADLLYDVRCLVNPHYRTELRPLTGRDAPVAAFLAADVQVQAMLADIQGFLTRWLPVYVADNRAYLTVALGCTGGQHRSVWFAETLAASFGASYQVLVRHRDLPP